MNEEMSKTELSEELMEQVSGGRLVLRSVPNEPIDFPENAEDLLLILGDRQIKPDPSSGRDHLL